MKQSAVTRQPARVKSAERVLDIVDALAHRAQGLTFTELQRALQLPKSSLHELLGVLTQRGYVEYASDQRRYILGIRVWERGQSYARHHDLIGEALTVMQSIGDRVNETVQLAVLDGIENVYLAKVDSSHPLRLQSEVGGRLFAHATGVGKVLLAALPLDELRRRLPPTLPHFTAHTFTERVALEDELARVRSRGFAVDAQEYTPGVVCVAVPILDAHHVVAAMSVSMPVTRATLPLLAASLHALAEGSLQITRRRGGGEDTRLSIYLDIAAAKQALAPLFDHMTRSS